LNSQQLSDTQELELKARNQEVSELKAAVAEAQAAQAAAEHATLTLVPLNLTVSNLHHRLAAATKEIVKAQVLLLHHGCLHMRLWDAGSFLVMLQLCKATL
jgi:hypothetical protein